MKPYSPANDPHDPREREEPLNYDEPWVDPRPTGFIKYRVLKGGDEPDPQPRSLWWVTWVLAACWVLAAVAAVTLLWRTKP